MFLDAKEELYRAKVMYYIIVWYSVLLVDNLKGNEEKKVISMVLRETIETKKNYITHIDHRHKQIKSRIRMFGK